MMQLFQTHNIVMFGEVHGNKQEYEWLCKLVKSAGFADRVDDIVVEFGNARYQNTVDRYIAGERVPFDQVQKAWRNMIASGSPVSPAYGWFYKAVREANLDHHRKHQIRILMGSPPRDWDKIRTPKDLAPYEAEREQWYAQVEMVDGFNSGWIHFVVPGTEHVDGATPLREAIIKLVTRG
jgi:hypothetical protein